MGDVNDPQPDYDSVPDWLAGQWRADLAAAARANARVLAGESLPEHQCRATHVHDAHDYLRVSAQKESTWYWCPGLAHDHQVRCCAEHGTHTTPHKGCLLR